MRLGVILPTFSFDAAEALEVAQSVEQAGIHGAFCYDHLWPLGEPGRPAISPYPLLGMLAEKTRTVTLGTLVSRVGLVPNSVLVSELLTIHALAGGRFIAALGTGDHKSALENLAYGVSYGEVGERQGELQHVARQLSASGVTVWIGGGAESTNEIAHECAVTLNLWRASVGEIEVAAARGEVSWAGRLPPSKDAAVRQLIDLRRAGSTWAVYIWAGTLEPLLAAAATAGIVLHGS